MLFTGTFPACDAYDSRRRSVEDAMASAEARDAELAEADCRCESSDSVSEYDSRRRSLESEIAIAHARNAELEAADVLHAVRDRDRHESQLEQMIKTQGQDGNKRVAEEREKTACVLQACCARAGAR